MTKVLVRLPADLLATIDERAARYKLSRAEWMRLALRRVASMPAQVDRSDEKRF